MRSVPIPTHPIHAALYRPVLFLGVEHTVIILEGTVVFALLVGVGLHVLTVMLAILVIAVGHPVMATLTARDPQMSRVYLRSLRFQDYYPAQSSLHARMLSVHASIPSTHAV